MRPRSSRKSARPLRWRKSLEEQIRIDEIELARRRRELRRRLEVDVADALLRRFAPRDIEHGRRSIDRRHRARSAARTEWPAVPDRSRTRGPTPARNRTPAAA